MDRLRKMHQTDKHKDIARCYKFYGFVFLKFNLEDEAEEALVKSMNIYKDLFGEESLFVANILKNLARVESQRRNFEKYKDLMNRAKEMKRMFIHPDEELWMINLATTEVEIELGIKTPESIAKAEWILAEIDEITNKRFSTEIG